MTDQTSTASTLNETESQQRCVVCGSAHFKKLRDYAVINNHSLGECHACGMVQALPVSDVSSFDYSDYGDYLLLTDQEICRRIRWVERHMAPMFRSIRARVQDATVVDFGSGAGYLCKAAQNYGFRAIGVELSNKLREFSKTRVGFENVVARIEDVHGGCDAIFMSDVIEHLAPLHSRKVMTEIVNHLNPGALLVGNTPNVRSVNIRISKDRDPVIAPPSHLCYFSMASLHRYLASLGLEKVSLYSRGLSSNSFLRKSKFKRSFLEKSLRQAKLYELPVIIPLRAFFAAAGFTLQPIGMGYQIYFAYQKPRRAVARQEAD